MVPPNLAYTYKTKFYSNIYVFLSLFLILATIMNGRLS